MYAYVCLCMLMYAYLPLSLPLPKIARGCQKRGGALTILENPSATPQFLLLFIEF